MDVRRPDAILVARCSSSRLPGKVLRNILGKPMIAYVIEKLKRCPSVRETCVATSTDPSDDPLHTWCNEFDVRCVRGPLNNVAGRVLTAAEEMSSHAFFRVNGDSPLLVTELFDRAWATYKQEKADIVSNVHPRTYPPGLSVELIRVTAMRRAVAKMSEASDREHVTAYMYRNPGEFTISNIESPIDYSTIHLAVDTPNDLNLITSILTRMQRPHWGYDVNETVVSSVQVSEPGVKPESGVRKHLDRSLLQRLNQWYVARTLGHFGAGAHIDRGAKILRYTRNVFLGANVIIKEGAKICPAQAEAVIRIGEWTTVGYNTYIFATSGVEIGANCLIAPFCYLVDANHGIRREALIRSQAMSAAPIRIGDDAWLGTGVTVLKGVQIGTGAVVAAGSVVSSDLPEYSISAGNPAIVIGMRK